MKTTLLSSQKPTQARYKHRFALAAVLVAGLAHASPAASLTTSLQLAANGKSRYVISVPRDAIPAENTAAQELQKYLQQVTGAKLAITTEGAVPESAPQLLVGQGTRVKRLLPRQNWAALGKDGIVIKSVGKHLVLAGGRPRGSLYAVYQFLEDSVGCRWWTATESTIPRKSTLNLPAQNVVYRPTFDFREQYTTDVHKDLSFAVKMRQNGTFPYQDARHGGHYKVMGMGHTFAYLLPPEKYFKDHPEWYSDFHNENKPCTSASAMPQPHKWQLNLTNKAMRAELTKNALEWVRDQPHAGVISVSQNDSQNYCRSAGDLAMIEREGSPSGPLIDCVNEVAAAIDKEFPGFLVDTFAYQYTRKPPKNIRPRENVIVRVCSIEGDFSKPLDSAANQGIRDDIKNWQAISKHLTIYDYTANFSSLLWPHPNLHVLAPNIRYFARNKPFGIFSQGDAYTNGCGDFTQLRTWLMGHLLWNPQLDEKKLTDDFMTGYYGAAAPHLQAYLDLAREGLLKGGQPLNINTVVSSYMNLAFITKAVAHFDAAAAAVKGNEQLSKRVRRNRLVLDNVIITRYKALQREVALGGSAAALPTDIAAFTAEFIRTAREFNVGDYQEAVPFSEYEKILQQGIKPTATLPEPLRSKLTPLQVETELIDMQENQFLYYYRGQFCDEVDDPRASDGRAGKMSGKDFNWLLQGNIQESADFLRKNRWHAYAVVRVETKPGVPYTGPAFSAGVYDTVNKKTVANFQKNLEDIGPGDYKLVDLGPLSLDAGQMVYVAPPNRDDLEGIYLDRVLFVPEK